MPQGTGQIASVSARQHVALAGRITAWLNQLDRYGSLQQAQQKAQQDIAALTTAHDALETKTSAKGTGPANGATDQASRLSALKNRSAERQILSIYDDRIQTEQQLGTVYGKWAAQVLVQHAIVQHLILRSVALILFILICMVLCDALVRKLMSYPALERRQAQTLRSVLQLSIQIIGVVLILLVIFGVPKETPTILGLATAALTIALQDFLLAFLGWFVLVGKNGMHVGDWVEINGVGGEVTDVGLFSTIDARNRDPRGQGTSYGPPHHLHEQFCHSGPVFQFFNQRAVDVGRDFFDHPGVRADDQDD